MGRLRPGDYMRDFSFRTPFGVTMTLREYGAGGRLLVVFLRYYGCTLCQYDLAGYAAGYGKITAAGGRLLVVLQSDPEMLAGELGTEDAFPFAIACDPGQELYREFGILPAAGKAKMVGPGTLIKMTKAKACGLKHGRYEGEELQLPAAFIVEPDGVVSYAHYGKTVDDVPDAAELAMRLGTDVLRGR